ncbi:MAG: esterase [Bacteroidaceae bacterium]|nr:esterase [Bacteroidaceae bacterium]MBP5347451.1 esterase [Bacteroidaceae bacterium]
MKLEEFETKGRRCMVYADEEPEVLLVEPLDERELEALDEELQAIKAGFKRRFAYVALVIKDWNRELAPWVASPVYGKVPFGNGAAETLRVIEDGVIPEMQKRFDTLKGADVVIGGYSLAGLFALWCGYESKAFMGVAAASPSVWYPRWIGHVGQRKPNARRVYLSLGDAEAKTKQPVMATVADNITALYDLLKKYPDVSSFLEWNEGGHFREPALRTARAFVWAVGW